MYNMVIKDRIVHKILTTNVFVSKCLDKSPLRTFCKRHRKTLMCLYFDCEEVQRISRDFERLIRNRFQVVVRLNKLHVIIGITDSR